MVSHGSFVLWSIVRYLCCDTEMETCEWLEALAPHAATVGYGIITPDVTRVSRLRGAQVAIMEAKKWVPRAVSWPHVRPAKCLCVCVCCKGRFDVPCLCRYASVCVCVCVCN